MDESSVYKICYLWAAGKVISQISKRLSLDRDFVEVVLQVVAGRYFGAGRRCLTRSEADTYCFWMENKGK